MVPTVAMAILMGVFPGIFLKPMEPSVARIIERVNGAASRVATIRPCRSPCRVRRPRASRPPTRRPQPTGQPPPAPDPAAARAQRRQP